MKKLYIIAIALLLGSSLAAKKAEPVFNIIPEPQSISVTKGTFKVKGANFNYDSFLETRTVAAIAQLSDGIVLGSGKVSSLAAAAGVNYGTPIESLHGVYFLKDATLKPEEYKIEIVPNAIKITAADHNGFLYAISTFKQLLPVDIYAGKPAVKADWKVPCCTIKDAPRFGYRGIMLDCARHFFTVDEVKKWLDVCAMYKINLFGDAGRADE